MTRQARDISTGSKRGAILVTSYPGQPSCAELERRVAAGEQPRKDYVELARALDADVIDSHYLDQRATPLAQAIARRMGLPAGQVAEAFLRQEQYSFILAWADRLGLPLALLFKLARSRRDLVMMSVRLSPRKKALLVQYLRAHTHLRAIVAYGSRQAEIAAFRLGVPRHKLHLALQPVDDRFWRPEQVPAENLICAVGSEQRDYPTLVQAVRGLDLKVELAIGTVVLSTFQGVSGTLSAQVREITEEGLPPNVSLNKFNPRELRSLYARSRFVVVPLKDVDYDAGVTAAVEAMAMGKAVVISRTRGQVDLIRDGEQGIYVPPGDPRALRAALEYLARHPEEAERMGRAGRALVERRHTLDAYIADVAALVRGTDASMSLAAEAIPLSQDTGTRLPGWQR